MNATVNSPIKVQEVYPYLRVGGAARAIDFYARAFGARELLRLTVPSGRIGHAEIKIGDSTLMLWDEYPELGIRGPLALGGTTCAIHLQLERQQARVLRPNLDAVHGCRHTVVSSQPWHQSLTPGVDGKFPTQRSHPI
jgi:uncharacterized glyoxalase superfamily protein PhnB